MSIKKLIILLFMSFSIYILGVVFTRDLSPSEAGRVEAELLKHLDSKSSWQDLSKFLSDEKLDPQSGT